MISIEFTAWGVPKAQPRAKACIRGNRAGVYDPGTANDWKSIVRGAARAQWSGKAFVGPVRVLLWFYLPRPKSHFTKKGLRTSAPHFVTSKPDLDNLEKSVLDALTNISMWKDDAQVAMVTKSKQYTEGTPRALIRIEEVEL